MGMDFFTRQRYSRFFKNAVFGILGLCLGVALGYFIGKNGTESVSDSIKKSLIPIEEKGTSYTFVRPLLAYRTPEATLFGDYVPLKKSLQAIADSAVSSSGATHVSVYFRDLDVGRWVGVNQDDTYYPASLLKVPTMIAFYKELEQDPSLFRTYYV